MIPDYKNKNLPVDKRVADLLSRMTIHEKVAQLHSAPWQVDLQKEDGSFDEKKAMAVLKYGICHVGRPGWQRSPQEAAELTNAIQDYLVNKTRLGVPALFHEEALHGFMAQDATIFPQAIALGSTWDPVLVERIYHAAAGEIRARGSNYVCTPDLDLARDPRWGRTEECFGEDPFLVTQMAKAAVKGLQGNGPGIDAHHVAATAKHFVAHGQPEAGTNTGPISLHERDLRETFFPPFKAAIYAGVLSVMASYNEISGVPTHINFWLLQDVLVGEWHFKGFVTSDGWAVDQLQDMHRVSGSPAESARLALRAGVDVEIEDGSCYSTLVEQVENGKIDEKIIDRAVERVLRVKFLLGLFENPFCDAKKADKLTNTKQNQSLALEAARKSLILLKNENNILPLRRENISKLAVIGPNAADLHLGGYSALPKHSITILEGIRKIAESDIEIQFAEGCRITKSVGDWRGYFEDEVQPADPADDDLRIDAAVQIAREADAAVLVIGENEGTCREGWGKHHLGDRDDLNLLGRQQELVERVMATGTPVIVVLVHGRPLAINRIAEQVPAILDAWYPGQEGGTAVAEALFGEINPCGKMTVSWPRSVGQIPCFYNHKPSARRGYLFSDNSPLFPFGFGLSYTTFEYSSLRLEKNVISSTERTVLYADVTNTGSRRGDEIVQLYVRDETASLPRPVKELKGFERIRLEPGETKTVEFVITPEVLGFYNIDMRFTVEPGVFELQVGGDCLSVQSIQLTVRE
ncbi:glycoside hydrolase family 3 C-terminal domain-containing protein [candidate division KSB1 bacterium]|nr:glycoside hydrolase family 3 C-terminal domain-containing protein [candidate division KSB1 bacterium]